LRLKDFLIGSGWTKEKVAYELNLSLEEIQTWEEIPNEYLATFQRWLFDLIILKERDKCGS